MSKKAGTNACGSNKLTLQYQGLTIILDEEENGRNYIVVGMEVSSPKWKVEPGIKIGTNLSGIKTKLNITEATTKEAGFEKLAFSITDGYANLYFRNKKLVKVTWELNLC